MPVGVAAPLARVHSDWDRDPSNDNWMLGDCEEDLNIDLTGQAAIDTGTQLLPLMIADPRTAPELSIVRPAAASNSANHAIRTPDPHCVGLLRASREQVLPGIAFLQPPTQAELHAISIAGLRILFDPRRVAEITRARGTTEDVKAAQALKAQLTLDGKGWAHTSIDSEFHGIFFGPQVVFRPGQSPYVVGQLMQWAVPFGLDTPGDISKGQEWAALLDEASSLLPLLEAEVLQCRQGTREFNISATICARGRNLAEAYFTLRAKELLPLMDQLGCSPLDAQAKTAIRGYVQQAVTLPKTWQHIEDMIAGGVFSKHGSDSALSENAARVTILRPFLTHLLEGQTRNWDTNDMITRYTEHRPSASLLFSTNLTSLAYSIPAVANLAQSFLAPTTAQPIARSAHSPRTPRVPSPPGKPHKASGAAGFNTHPLYFSGEYEVPPGWVPPPLARQRATPPDSSKRTPIASALCIPTARAINGSSSPFITQTVHACDACGTPGHAQYECPKRFFETFLQPLPGFLPSGAPDPASWAKGDLTPHKRREMAEYLASHQIPPHRRFGVTLEHIRTGIAPPPPIDDPRHGRI